MSLLSYSLSKYGKTIELSNRNLSIFNGEPIENFTDTIEIQAITKTLTGVSVFDDTNTERVATHEVIIAYIDGVTSEKWIKLGTKRIKILTVENCCETNQVLTLMCTERGEDSKVVNNA